MKLFSANLIQNIFEQLISAKKLCISFESAHLFSFGGIENSIWKMSTVKT